MNIYIYDSQPRGIEIGTYINKVRIENNYSFINDIQYSPEVFGLNDCLHEIELPCVVFLHLGDGETYGNYRSLEFYANKLKNKEIGVIAYTGGDVLECPVPNDFLPTVNDRNWHCYLNGINDAIDLRLDKFFKKYSDSIYTSPPLYLLKNEIQNPLISVFILCEGYLIAKNTTTQGGGYAEPFNEILKEYVKIWQKKYSENEKLWWGILNGEFTSQIYEELSCNNIKSDNIKKLLYVIINSSEYVEYDLVKNAYEEIKSYLILE